MKGPYTLRPSLYAQRNDNNIKIIIYVKENTASLGIVVKQNNWVDTQMSKYLPILPMIKWIPLRAIVTNHNN